MFYRHQKYSHCNPNASLDIVVLSVLHKNEELVKLKIHYVCRKSGRLQYCGKGRDGFTDTVKIYKEDYKNWRLANE